MHSRYSILKKPFTIILLLFFMSLTFGLKLPEIAAADIIAPTCQSSEVTTKGDVSITFDQPMANPAGTEDQFTIEVDGEEANITGVQLTNTPTKIKLVLETKVLGGQSVTVAYDKGDDEASQVKSTDGGILESFSETVTNELPQDNIPVITLIGNTTINLTLNDNYTEPGFSATDDVDGDITANVIVSGDTVDTSVIGTYVITYNVSDSAGNAATEVKRTIMVSNADGSGSGDESGSGQGDGTGAGSGTPGGLSVSFYTPDLSADNTILRFNLSNGIDNELSENLNKIHVYEESDNNSVQYYDYDYIEQGSISNPPKIRRLELYFNDLQAGTTYVVEMDSDFASNNSSTLGTTQWFEFTTQEEEIPWNVVTTSGGTISDLGTTVIIPDRAFDSNIEVQIEKVSNISNLPMAAMSKLLSDIIEITKDESGDFSKPVTITLNFDKTKVDLDEYKVSIYWFDEKADKWVELSNVEVDLTNGKVSGEVQHFTKFAVIATEKEQLLPATALKDITGHWAEANINKLVASGAISGYPDGTFTPDNTITRAEFVSIIVKAFKLVPKDSKVFNDTANHWAKDAISIAAGNGIVGGYDSANFGPDDKITREQMAVIIDKLISNNAAAGKTFADGAEISAWAKEAIARVSGNGIISGYPDNTFKAKSFATRAEAVTVIVSALGLIK